MHVHTPIKVRYGETDMMGVVYHANYLLYFEDARTAFLEAIGYPYARIEEAGGALFGRSEEENHRRLTLILEQLDDRIKTVRGELGEKQKIYATVSMVMGGMLVILLI